MRVARFEFCKSDLADAHTVADQEYDIFASGAGQGFGEAVILGGRLIKAYVVEVGGDIAVIEIGLAISGEEGVKEDGKYGD